MKSHKYLLIGCVGGLVSFLIRGFLNDMDNQLICLAGFVLMITVAGLMRE